MTNPTHGMFLLNITKEGLEKKEMDKICGISKNTVAERLWNYPLINSSLIQENNDAVERFDAMKQKGDLDKYYFNIFYHVKKRASWLLTHPQNELKHALSVKVLSLNDKEKAEYVSKTIRSLFIITRGLYQGKPFSDAALPTASGELYIDELFQIWLLLYILAEKENIPKEELRKVSFALSSFLQCLMM
jgi:hypothetical protein